MAQLTQYEDFLDRVDELGFMVLSPLMPGLASLSAETPGRLWHTGDRETDPWQWKDRAAEEKRLAYGCILGGYRGFVAERMYAVFYTACHPPEIMPDRWAAGVVSQSTWQLWQLFERRVSLDTSDVRREMGVSPKNGASRVDGSLRELQQHFYITVAGSRRKIGGDGQPYGWPASIFQRIYQWAPEGWMGGIERFMLEEAREMILDAAEAAQPEIDRNGFARKMGFYE
jgi:hypothetical protein